MTRISQKTTDQLGALQPMLALVEKSMGFVPNSMLTMAHWPELLQSFGAFGGVVLGSGLVTPAIKQLVAFVVSHAAGCRYCQAHTSHTAELRGVAAEKIEAAFRFEESPLFDARERAALRLAFKAGAVPNETTDADFVELRQHFSEREIVELVAVISLFGFLNRWNDTMATSLEASPRAFAAAHLSAAGWEIGKHG